VTFTDLIELLEPPAVEIDLTITNPWKLAKTLHVDQSYALSVGGAQLVGRER
jgi:hypothetical protein